MATTDIIKPSLAFDGVPDPDIQEFGTEYEDETLYALNSYFEFYEIAGHSGNTSLPYVLKSIWCKADITVPAGSAGTLTVTLYDLFRTKIAETTESIGDGSESAVEHTFVFNGLSAKTDLVYVGFSGTAMKTRGLKVSRINARATYTPFTVTGISPISVDRFRQEGINFSWSYSGVQPDGLTLVAGNWSKSVSGLTGTSAPANTFPLGSVSWYFNARVVLTNGSISKEVGFQCSPTYSFTVSNAPISVSASTDKAFVYESGELNFTWTLDEGTQAHAQIQVSTDNVTWTNFGPDLGSSNRYGGYGSDFAIGTNYWRVNVTTTDGRTGSGGGNFSVMEDPPETHPPTIVEVTTSAVQPTGLDPAFDGIQIAGISRLKVVASVTAGTNPISSVAFSYPNADRPVTMSLNQSTGKYEGTTLAALPESTTITVEADDTGGFYTRGFLPVDVESYSPPTIQIKDLFRCDASGTADETGKRYKVKAVPNCASVDGKNRITAFRVGLKGGTSVSILYEQDRYYLSETDELINPDLLYTIELTATDLIGRTGRVERALAGMLRDVVFRRDIQHHTAHVGIGMAPITPGMEACHTLELPQDAKIIIGGVDVIAWLDNRLKDLEPGTGGSNATTESSNNEGDETS